MSEINYLIQKNTEFYENESGLLMLKYNGEDLGRVAVRRMFPLKFEDEYLSVCKENFSRSDKNEEIGIIRSLDDFTEEQAKIIKNELERRYFIPEIVKVKSVSDEFGHTYWKVETTAGEREFTVEDMASNLIRLSENSVILVDVYGNRYFFADIKKLGDKAMQTLEIWI